MTCDSYKFRDEHSECFVLFSETSDQNEDLLGKVQMSWRNTGGLYHYPGGGCICGGKLSDVRIWG